MSDQTTPSFDANTMRSLEKLRDRVVEAAEEIKKLREENAELARNVAALEAEHPLVARTPGSGVLEVEALSEMLTKKVEQFVRHVDALLVSEQNRLSEPPDTGEGEEPDTQG